MQKITSVRTNFESVRFLGEPSEVLTGLFVSKRPLENKAEFLRSVWEQAGFEAKVPLYLKQVHSGTVVQLLNGKLPAQTPTGDAVITDSKDVFLVIQVADCLPVLFCDPLRKFIAGAHASWKGSLLGIVPEVVRQLVRLGSQVEDLRVWLGPSIHACCYQVGMERSVLFPRWPESTRHIDLISLNLKLLEQAGIRKENISVDPRCTACCPEGFPSYRREGKKAGRIFACIALK